MGDNRIIQLKEKVFTFVTNKGPILPSAVAKEFRSTSLFISALLSELVTEKRVLLTKAKIGSSPLYYVSSQKPSLSKLLKNYVGQKPKEAMDTLKEKKVLRDRDCLPYERVALRELADFAKPVRLVVQDTEEIFWKWYLLPDLEAKGLIEGMLHSIYNPKTKEEDPVQEIKEEKQDPVQEIKEEKQDPVQEIKEEAIKIKPKEIINVVSKGTQTKLVKKEAIKEKVKRRVKKPKVEATYAVNLDDDFEKIIIGYLKKKKISILDKTTIKKDRELNFIVSVPSNVGTLRYFVKARKKKKLNEGDLLLAFTEGQDKKLATIIVSNAEITKKAKLFIEKSLPGLTYIKLE
jgi:hypothetical protein